MHGLDRQHAIQSASSLIPAGAGELVQGQLASGEDFLITNPVACFSSIRVVLLPGHGEITVFPHDRVKVKRAAEATLKFFQINHLSVFVFVASSIPLGKGMASSTADIVATIEAIIAALEKPVDPGHTSQIAISIEPSDGLMYRGTVLYNHRRGQLIEALTPAPAIRQLVIDTGGQIDTIEFNKRSKNYTREELAQQAQALCLVKDGLRYGDMQRLGQGATLSTLINQRVLPKPGLESILQVAKHCGAYGIACAHSGTILSLLFDPENVSGVAKARRSLEQDFTIQLETCSIQSW
jgi:L-threonine kinase